MAPLAGGEDQQQELHQASLRVRMSSDSNLSATSTVIVPSYTGSSGSTDLPTMISAVMRPSCSPGSVGSTWYPQWATPDAVLDDRTDRSRCVVDDNERETVLNVADGTFA